MPLRPVTLPINQMPQLTLLGFRIEYFMANILFMVLYPRWKGGWLGLVGKRVSHIWLQ